MLFRRLLTVFVGAWLFLGSGAALAQSWDIPADTIKGNLTKVGGSDKFASVDVVVVFDRREVTVEDSGLSRTVQHTLTKALTPAGARELAVGIYAFDPLSADVEVLRCRVYGASGTVRDVDVKTLLDLPDPQGLIYWNARHKLLAIGRIEPSDAVEVVTRRVGFTYALLADEQGADETRFVPPMKGHFYDIVPFWSSYPVMEQNYRVTIPIEKNLQYQFYNGAAEIADRIENGKRVVTFTTRDFKPLEREPAMVSWSDVAPKLLLTTALDWKAKAVWFYNTQEEAKCFAVTPELQKIADEVTAGMTKDEDKASALNHWVAENIRYIGLHMGKGEGYTLHPAAMTLADRGGVCKDKAGILVALLRAVGLESYPAMTMAGERIEKLAADQFNHCVTVWRKPDKTTVLLDPTWVPGAREMWSSREQQQEVLMGLPEGADIMTTPLSPPENHPLTVAITSTLKNDGTLEGTMSVVADGQSDSGLRGRYRGRFRSEWPAVDATWLTTLDPRTEVTNVTHIDPDDLSKPFSLQLSFRIVGYARVLDDGTLLLTPLSARHPVGQMARAEELFMAVKPAERKYTLRIGCTKLVKLTEKMKLPEGAKVEGLPETVKLDGNGSLDANWKVEKGELVVSETLAMRSRLIEPEKWPELKKAVEAFRKLAETQLVIKPVRGGKEKA